jgi:hypothetical protein
MWHWDVWWVVSSVFKDFLPSSCVKQSKKSPWSWRWRCLDPSKYQKPLTQRHSVTSLKTLFHSNSAVRNWRPNTRTFLMFCWLCIIVYQYNETNVMHFSFSLLRIKGLYMFPASLAHPQEMLNNRHLVYCMCIMSVGCAMISVKFKKCRGT